MKKPKNKLEAEVSHRQKLIVDRSLARIEELRKLLDATERCLAHKDAGYPIYLDDLGNYAIGIQADAISFTTLANFMHDMKRVSKRPKR